MEGPKVPKSARPASNGLAMFAGLGICVALLYAMATFVGSKSAAYKAEQAPQRQRAADTIRNATPAIRWVSWRDDTFLVVIDRQNYRPQLPDALCNALRGQGVRGRARVEVREASAFLNERREVLGDAACSLPR